MDINDINNIGHAWASWERNEANKGKGVRSKGWVTKEQMRKNAAQKTLGILIVVAVLTALSAIFIKIFGKAVGALMMVILVLGLPICWFIHENFGYNVQWLPLWIVGFALLLKIFTKMFGRKWGLRIGVPILAIVGVAAYVDPEKNANSNVSSAQVPLDAGAASKYETRDVNKKKGDIRVVSKRMGKSELGTSNMAASGFNSAANETSSAEAAQYLKDMSARLDELFVRIRSNNKPNTADYELRSRVEYLKNMYEQELRRMPYDNKSLSETKTVADKAYMKVSEHAYRMHWIISDDEKRLEQEIASYFKGVSAKFENLCTQVRANNKPPTPNYEINLRVEYLKDMFDGEMRSPLCDRWNSLEEAKLHADKAYKTCLDHALRMEWIDGMSYIK